MTAERDRATAPVVLAVRDLAAAPPGVTAPAVRLASLTLRRGEWVAITGGNGAGKTTLALALAGLWPAAAGVRSLPDPNVRIATLLQEPATQITQRTVREEIAFTALNLGLGEAAALEAAERWARRLGLGGLLERTPDSLSAGQQQRVLIAAALAAAPDLLIADEAAAHLDHEQRLRILEILRERADGGLTVIWVTQDPDEIRHADRLLRVGDEHPSDDVAVPTPTMASASADSPAATPSATATVTTPMPPVHAAAAGPETTRVLVRIVPRSEGRVTLSDPLEIAIGDRGVWAIVGPNGSGKTSVLEALAGVEPIPGMEISWRDSVEHPPILAGQYPERQIFEERVGDEIRFAALRRGVPAMELESRMTEMFRVLELSPGFAVLRTWELSTGEKRLVSIVATLLTPASLLLLDEPTCGLDPARRAVVGEWVRAASGRIPIVVATQDLAWIREVAAIEVPLGMRDGVGGTFSDRHAKSQQKNGLTEPCSSA